MKRQRTNKAEIRPEEQSEKTESRRENVWNEIQLKEPKDRNIIQGKKAGCKTKFSKTPLNALAIYL